MRKNYLFETKLPFMLQLFAEDGDGAGAGDGNGGGSGEGDGAGEPGGEGKQGDTIPPSFDDFLKESSNQAEFDRRVQKSIDTAVKEAQKKWQVLTDDKISEAEKLAKLSKEEREAYKTKKEREEFAAEKAAFEKEKLLVEVKSGLQKESLPISFADALVEIADAEKIKTAIAELKTTWDAEITEAIKAKARQSTPGESGQAGAGGKATISIGQMAKENRIIKN